MGSKTRTTTTNEQINGFEVRFLRLALINIW